MTERQDSTTTMTRDAYRQIFEARLKELEARIAILQARAEKASADAKIEFDQQLQVLNQKYMDARNRLKDWRASAEDAWDELRSGMEESLDELSEAVENAGKRLS